MPPEPRLRILDVGTGTGFLAILLAGMGNEVVGMDLSEAMLGVARREAETRSLQAEFLLGDVESPPQELGPFDVVASRHVLWTLQRPEAAVRAWARLLRPNGRVVVIDGLWRSTALSDRALAVGGRALRRLRRSQPDDHHGFPASVSGRLPLQHLSSLEPARNLFLRAGLDSVLCEELAWIDNIERGVMPVDQRLQHRYRRYLLGGPGDAPRASRGPGGGVARRSRARAAP